MMLKKVLRIAGVVIGAPGLASVASGGGMANVISGELEGLIQAVVISVISLITYLMRSPKDETS
jgi:hypothetical protein